MTFKHRLSAVLTAIVLIVMLMPLPADAQVSSGPMTVQRIGNSAFIAPDFKITDFNGKASGLVGAYGGLLVEQTVLVGLGGYWLTDTSSHDDDLWYFGFVTGVYVHQDRKVGAGFKMLIGGGEA